jgi:hypothetical protein
MPKYSKPIPISGAKRSSSDTIWKRNSHSSHFLMLSSVFSKSFHFFQHLLIAFFDYYQDKNKTSTLLFFSFNCLDKRGDLTKKGQLHDGLKLLSFTLPE